MVDSDRRPTAQEIEELIDLVRRDPSSPAFIDLGEAYLALGRPKDAVAIGNVGIQAAPDSLEGSVMLARAYAQLHQWKEAQGELLRVVKVDRSSRQGFALLGEVLLRRQDFERAVPVLQHAQNLDPTSPQILAMLKRARANQALDPPPPLPTPVPPRGETNYGLQLDAPPARSAPPPPKAPSRPAPPPLSSRWQCPRRRRSSRCRTSTKRACVRAWSLRRGRKMPRRRRCASRRRSARTISTSCSPAACSTSPA